MKGNREYYVTPHGFQWYPEIIQVALDSVVFLELPWMLAALEVLTVNEVATPTMTSKCHKQLQKFRYKLLNTRLSEHVAELCQKMVALS